MAVHFFTHSTSINGTTTPPNTATEIWSMSGANCKIIDIFWPLEDAGARQNKINFSQRRVTMITISGTLSIPVNEFPFECRCVWCKFQSISKVQIGGIWWENVLRLGEGTGDFVP